MIYHFTIEPLVFFICLVKGFLIAVESPGYYYKACLHILEEYSENPTIARLDCSKSLKNFTFNHSSGASLIDEVQKTSADYFLAITISTSVSIAIGNIIFGIHGDIFGRKTAILVGQIGVVGQAILWILTLAYMDLPMYVNPLGLFILGFSGLLMGTLSASSQYLADLFAKKEDMMIKIAVMNFSLFVGMIIGTFGAGGLLKYLSFAETLSISLFSAVISIMCTFFMIKPQTMGYAQCRGEEEPSDSMNFCQKLRQGIWNGACDLWNSISKDRPDGKRRILILSILAYFCARASDQGAEGVLSLYSFSSPFYLDSSEHAFFTGLSNGLQAFGALFGTLLFKKAFKASDEFCALIGLASIIARFAVVAAASTKTWLYLSAVSGMCSDIFLSAFQSFLYKLIEEDEIGKITAVEVTSIHVSMIVTGIVFNRIYRATIGTFSRSVFILVAAFPVPALFFFGFAWKSMRDKKRTEKTICVE